MRVVYEQGPLMLLVLGFTAAFVSHALGLEIVVVGFAAGCFLINQTRAEGERLLRALQRAAGPLYAVTFVLLGAGLTPGALADVWPWVMAVAAVRAFGLHYGLIWAGRDVAVSPTLTRNGWLGLVSQAGVTLGLAALVRRAFPEWGVSLEAFVLGMIGVHEIIGPIMFRWALQRPGAGEARNADVVQADSAVVVPGVGNSRL
jgi:Kef-type K+ transport system membrane component KefB